MATGLARVTVNTPRRRVDVALPDQAPVAELLPELLRHAGDEPPGDGGWVLRRLGGAGLAATQGLQAQGVRDGDVLHLAPAMVDWPEPEYDDVAEAIAAGAGRRGVAWSPEATRRTVLAVAGALLVGALAAAIHGGSELAAAVPGAAAGVALLLSSLLGAVAAGVAPATANKHDGTAGRPRVLTAGVTVGLVGGLAVLCGYGLGAAGAAAVLACGLVCGIGAVPVVAIRLGRLPMPRPGAADRLPDRHAIVTAVARTDEMLTGVLVGWAVLAVAAIAVLLAEGTLVGRALAAVTALAMLLRARLFIAVRQRLPLLASGLAGLAGLGAALVAGAATDLLPMVVATATGAALLVALAAANWASRRPSAYLARAADLVDTLVLVSVVPVAAGVLGLYAAAQDLVS